ncbi:MAG TPA: NADH-quinone oxidoreductase subunit L [Thermoanaerobaculia bacterium]|jgi:NADH-quinone oxidoreductase subunit L|nr:NADH-quinone oxidoreductase subunit L [Thermoanaerobaculia bacterium]
MLNNLWLIPITPFLGFLLNGLFGKRAGKGFVTAVALAASLGAALLGTVAVFQYNAAYTGGARHLNVIYEWFNSAGIGTDIAFQLDPLSVVMLMVVTWIGFLIHVYSVGYMHHEEGYWRYFAYLNLFLASMLILILGSSYLFMFVGWEGVGLCSYLLIGFYYQTDYAPPAGKKAFIVNRIGDFGFLIAMFLMFKHIGSVDFIKVQDAVVAGGVAAGIVTAICLLLFVGATGKSAQIPLFVWLPDAMAGPTPVSALIHAATMVTAGVYMIVRSNALYRLSPNAMMVVAIIGGLTALFAATIGVRQFDIKKVLAYSTVSQLGFMFIAVGVGAYAAGVFHLVTHAFFKACLFLGSGSVIHAMSGEQDIRNMGGLKDKIPQTYRTFAIATYAIAGLPLAAGFFSKDEILVSAWSTPYFPMVGKIVWLLGTLAAFFTAFYMYRLVYLTFFGKFRGTHEQEHHLHESPASMTGPLWVLAILSVLGGLLSLPHALWHGPSLSAWLLQIIPEIPGTFREIHLHLSTEIFIALFSTVVAIVGWLLARKLYKEKELATDAAFEQRFPALARAIENKWYVDELYDAIVVRPLKAFSVFCWKGIDAVIDGIAAMLGYIVRGFGDILRFFQTGNVRNYALMFFIGVIVFVTFFA